MSADAAAIVAALRAGQEPPPTPELAADDLLALLQELKRYVEQERLQHPQRALAIADVGQALAERSGLPRALALAAWMRGNALNFLGDHEQALAAFRFAQQIYAAAAEPLPALILQINQVGILQKQGEYQAAAALAATARELGGSLGDAARRPLAGLDMNVGSGHQQRGEFAAALAAYERARRNFAALDEPIQVARVEVNLANVLEEQGRYREAEQLLLQAREQLAAHHVGLEVARANHNLGWQAYHRGLYLPALRYLEEASQGFAAIPNPAEVAMVDILRADIYRELNMLPETIELAGVAAAAFETHALHWHQMLALTILGNAYARAGREQPAEQALSQAQAICRAQQAPMRARSLELARAELALQTGDWARAERLGRELLPEFVPDQWPEPAARLHLLLAESALRHTPPDIASAHAQLDQAHRLSERHQIAAVAVALCRVRGQAHEAAQDYPAALGCYEQAIERTERQRSQMPIDVFQLSFMDDKLILHQRAAQLCLLLGDQARLLNTLSRALGHLAPADRRERNPHPWQAELQHLREQWHAIQRQLESQELRETAFSDAPPQRETEQRDQQAALESQIAALTRQTWIHQAASQPSALASPAEHWLARLQARLADGEIVLWYVLINQTLHAWRITSTACVLEAPLCGQAELARSLAAWYFHLEHGGHLAPALHARTTLNHLRRLHRLVFAALEPALAGVRVLNLMIPPEIAHLPFAGLHDSRSFLAERMILRHLASWEAAGQPLSRQPAGQNALVIGWTDQGRLPHAAAEASAIATLLSERYATTCLIEDQVRHADVLAALPASQLIHLASHAMFRPDQPLFSWIGLHDARLTVAEMYSLTLPPAALVVLSACQTGRGTPSGGGLLGMARGLLSAGASEVIVSQWRLADQPAATLMGWLYTALIAEGLAPAAAVRRAQCQAIQAGLEPSHWAGYLSIEGGNWR